jgi:hypothetical protein
MPGLDRVIRVGLVPLSDQLVGVPGQVGVVVHHRGRPEPGRSGRPRLQPFPGGPGEAAIPRQLPPSGTGTIGEPLARSGQDEPLS